MSGGGGARCAASSGEITGRSLNASRSAEVNADAEYHVIQSTPSRLCATPYTVRDVNWVQAATVSPMDDRTGAPPTSVVLVRVCSAGLAAAGHTHEQVLPSSGSFWRLQCPQNALKSPHVSHLYSLCFPSVVWGHLASMLLAGSLARWRSTCQSPSCMQSSTSSIHPYSSRRVASASIASHSSESA